MLKLPFIGYILNNHLKLNLLDYKTVNLYFQLLQKSIS